MLVVITISIFIFFLGALLTSFIHLVANRVPNKEPINGRSMCPKCHKQLRWMDIIPFFGYFINNGKCHNCGSKIPIIHPIMEFIGGILFVLSFHVFGLTLELAAAWIIILVLLCESISDMNEQIVIDRVWIVGIIPLIIIRIMQDNILSHLLSAGVMFVILYLIAYSASKILKKEALGGGDIKLYLFIGFALTIEKSFLSLFLASIIALIYSMIKGKGKESYIPLVPFITLGVLISYFLGDTIINLYLSLLGV
jgi:prepilin signal peptidase PulO-like enzyme (type II secretory pathway)